MEADAVVRVSTKFQVTISKELSERFQLEAEEILVFLDVEGTLVLTKNTEG